MLKVIFFIIPALFVQTNSVVQIDTAKFNPRFERVKNNIPTDRKISGNTEAYVDKLLSFAILAGNIQYFSPTDPVQDLYYEHGWENFYANGVRLAAEAKNERSFADALVKLFRPIEPSLTIIYNKEVLCAPSEILKKRGHHIRTT